MKKSSYLQKDLESEFKIDNVLIPETHSSDYSLPELSEDDDVQKTFLNCKVKS